MSTMSEVNIEVMDFCFSSLPPNDLPFTFPITSSLTVVTVELLFPRSRDGY